MPLTGIFYILAKLTSVGFLVKKKQYSLRYHPD